ncbi:Ulp1-like peptidase [Cucumis melo var. makuwa]|uniref:Ulp1-like peptidase n=1 Tax=Cucumis melo var. makuwa TaxID=1194695 RepID=A0A5D3C1C4_CUCMM|nr:Ulp1-like peptidase [Cucumis melo var. makuwa]TYK05155.1 Ulp1-like peptidase [Cucumis melo var. makuwa]
MYYIGKASPDRLYPAALLRNRFADTILKAREKALEKGGVGNIPYFPTSGVRRVNCALGKPLILDVLLYASGEPLIPDVFYADVFLDIGKNSISVDRDNVSGITRPRLDLKRVPDEVERPSRGINQGRVAHGRMATQTPSIIAFILRREFNIITGLRGPKEDYIQLVGNSRLLEKFFKDNECIYVSDLEDIFLEYEGDDDDIVKLALVYFIEISLLGKDRRTKVDIGFFKIADDWNTFNNYNWGRIVFGRTLSALKRALDKQYAKGKKKSTQTKKYTINGFPHALQVWAYESISTINGCGVDKVNDHAIPRMLRWVCQQSLKSQTISQVFDSPMFIIKAVIEMTPKEEQLKLLQSKKQKSKTKMKKAIRNLQDRVTVVERQLTCIKSDIDELKSMMSTILKHIGLQRKGDEGDRKVSKGLVDHTLKSKEVNNAKTEDVNTGGTPNWLRMPKEDEHIELKKKGDEDVNTVGTPPWLRFNIELAKPVDVLEKKVDIGLEEPIDVVDDEVEIEDSGKKLCSHFDEDVTEIEPFSTQRPHVRPARRKRASVYLSTPFTTLPKRSVTSTTTTSQSEPIVYDPMHKILDVHLDRFRAWITDKRTDDEVRETFHEKKSEVFFRDLFMCRQWLADEHLDALFLFIRLKIKAAGIPSSQNFTTADTIFMRILVAKWPLYKECIKENRSFDWKEEYRLVDYVVGSKEDFQDPWASVDYVYSPFNVHANH